MIDTVFFDLDNTIFDFNKAEHIALARRWKSWEFHRRKRPAPGTA